jgi:hypothetical protein
MLDTRKKARIHISNQSKANRSVMQFLGNWALDKRVRLAFFGILILSLNYSCYNPFSGGPGMSAPLRRPVAWRLIVVLEPKSSIYPADKTHLFFELDLITGKWPFHTCFVPSARVENNKIYLGNIEYNSCDAVESEKVAIASPIIIPGIYQVYDDYDKSLIATFDLTASSTTGIIQ